MKEMLLKFARQSMVLFAILAVACVGQEDEEDNLPLVVSGFTHTINVNTGTVTFINTSTNATQYLWDFGDATSSTEINPIKTFISGTYTVKLKASNVAGASDTFEDTITIQITSKPALPITFDISTVNYTPTVFAGAQFEIVSNPSVSGSNNKASKVGAITNSGAAFEGLFFDLGADIDLVTNKRITMNFWSEASIGVLLKLEGTNPSIEKSVTHGGTGWEAISFDFTSSNKYSKLTLFVDGPGTTAGTFYFDDIVQEAIPAPPLTCTEDVDQSLSAANFNMTFKTDPSSSIISDNAGFEWANNPDEEDLNKSCKVGKISRTAASLFANNQINLDAKLNFVDNSGFKMKVYSDVTGFKVLLKLEDKASAGTFTELEVTTTKTNEWEELTFPFASSQTNKYDKIIIFFDLNTNREKIYYFDDLKLYQATGGGSGGCTGTLVAATSLPLDFEGCQTFLSSENFGAGITSVLAANPSKTGINTSNYVLKVDKPTGSDFYAGIQNTFASNFNLTTTNVFKVKVYSTKANVVFRFELAVNPQTVPVTGNPAPVYKTIANANEWTEVSFTFTGLPGAPTAYNQLVVKPDNTATDSPITEGGTYYIDDLSLSAGSAAPTAPTTAAPTPPARAAGDVISIFSGAYSNITGVDYNPNWGQSTVTTTIDVAGNATLKYAGLNYQGTDFSGNAQNVSAMQFLHIDFWTANSTALNTFIISPGAEKAKALTVPTAGNWTSIDIPLTDFAPPVNLANIIQFKFDGNGDIYLDNLYFYKSAGGSGPIVANGDFETGTDSGWLRFQNGGTSVLDNTTNNGGTWSGKLATNGPSNPAFKQERIGAGVVKAGDVVRVKFDHKGSVVQPGAVFNVLLFGEGAAGASFTHVFNPAPTLGTNWVTFTGNFTIPSGTDVSEGISFLIEAVCGGDAGCSVTANIDNVSITLNP